MKDKQDKSELHGFIDSLVGDLAKLYAETPKPEPKPEPQDEPVYMPVNQQTGD